MAAPMVAPTATPTATPKATRVTVAAMIMAGPPTARAARAAPMVEATLAIQHTSSSKGSNRSKVAVTVKVERKRGAVRAVEAAVRIRSTRNGMRRTRDDTLQ